MSSKRINVIAKNTFLLYLRSFVVLLLTLYTSRIILDALGVKDYGLYNVVGGVVSLFAFLRTSLTKSTQRFLNVEMTKERGNLIKIFQVSLTLHVLIAIIAFLLLESIGLWFLNNYIQIPEGRVFAANLVFQSTIISLLITIITVPYSACIIAHESMGYFAIVSIVDAILKLVIALMLSFDFIDKLIVYGWLMMIISFINLLMYICYCRIKFSECRWGFLLNRELVKEMTGYTTWTIVGQVAIVGTNQGNSILVNIFHSVTANAAMGVASQINNAIVSLTANFQTAFNPQITKSYSRKDYTYLTKLIFSTSKISFFLLTIVSFPVFFNIDWILNKWLTIVPPDTSLFCILIIVNSILNALSAPLNFCVLSSGKIKWFQLVTSLIYLFDLPILYLLFYFGGPPITAMIVKIGVMVLILFVRYYFCAREVPNMSFISYINGLLIPIMLYTLSCLGVGYVLFYYVELDAIIRTVILLLFSLFLVYYIGLSKFERMELLKLIKEKC